MTCALSDDRSRVSCLAPVRCRSGGEFGGWALGAYMRDFAVEPRSGNVTATAELTRTRRRPRAHLFSFLRKLRGGGPAR